jgi:hypothetical protein
VKGLDGEGDCGALVIVVTVFGMNLESAIYPIGRSNSGILHNKCLPIYVNEHISSIAATLFAIITRFRLSADMRQCWYAL